MDLVPETAISEHDLQKKCVARLRAHNFIVLGLDAFNGMSFIRDLKSKSIYKQHTIAMGASPGQPDCLILNHRKGGKAVFVEYKFRSGKLSPDQLAYHKLLKSLGYDVLVWKTENECVKWILDELGLKVSKEGNG